MPMPRLLKRLSRKSLRQSDDSNGSKQPQRSNSEPPPPLPPKTPDSSYSQYGTVTPQPMSRSPSSPSPLPRGSPSLPNGTNDNGQLVHNKQLSLPPSLPPANDITSQDDLSVDFSDVWNKANQAPKVSKTDKVLQKLENGILGAQADQANAQGTVTGVTAVLTATGGMAAIEQGVNTFLEGSTVLMNALDEVAKLHPFVGVAVMAFKAVWTLEMKRRENDKKIIALHVEMKDMMAVLLQLKNVKDAEEVAPDNTTIKGRMQALIHATADDIKACANTCDTYSKKKLVVKVLKGPMWEPKLLKYVETFTKRRGEFEFALTIHTALGVDTANRTLGDVNKTTQEMNAKMELMMQMFQNFMTSEEKQVARHIEAKGGSKACQEDDKLLKELNEFEQKANPSASGGAHVRKSAKSGKPSDLEDLKEDLHADPDEAIEKNMAVYSRKFEIQKRQIVDELSRVVQREGDRVIGAITSGPHDKIIDPDVHKIWKEMNWRGSVKARHFVMALRDYFHEKWYADGSSAKEANEGAPAPRDNKADEWALAFLSVIRLQPISEAFDDDASGFVTVVEANTFTTSRPLGWSLPQWIAYWAVGWHQSMVTYADKIHGLIEKMFAILPHIQAANLASVHVYLDTIYAQTIELQSSINACDAKDSPRARFSSYVEAEEGRLMANLEAVDYDIDAMDTLALVTGPGRIERFIFPLIYLLLKRHFEIFRVCQTRTVHPDELWDCADTLVWIYDAVADRVNILESIFKGQKLDLKHQFATFAHGIFEYWHEPGELWSPARVKENNPTDYPYDDDKEDKDVDIEKILNYPIDKEELDFAAYTLPSHDELAAAPEPSEPHSAILGPWNGLMYWRPTDTLRNAGMIAFAFRPSAIEGDGRHFEASGRANMTDFAVSGECSPGETSETVNVSFKRTFPARHPPLYYQGQWNAATDSITGKWGVDSDPTTHMALFVLKRTAPEYLRFRPAPVAFETNKPRALWSFALSAIQHNIRRQSWSWSFFKQRRENRERFIELYIRVTQYGTPLNQTESTQLSRIRETFTPADSRFNHSLAEYRIRRIIGHNGVGCDECGGRIGGARIICLVCQTKETFDTVDLCERPECIAAEVERDDIEKSHLPTHDLMKVRRVVHPRNFGKLDRAAKAALNKARAAFGQYDSDDKSEDAGGFTEAHDGGNKPAERVGLTCGACKASVTQPCWYCVQCPNDVFICNNCDAKGPATFGAHEGTHDLVRCQELVEDVAISVEDRLASLEERFANHETAINERLHQLEMKVNDRLSRVETLLESLIELSAGGFGSIRPQKRFSVNGKGVAKETGAIMEGEQRPASVEAKDAEESSESDSSSGNN